MGKTTPKEARIELKKRLPVYMVPRKIFQTETMPLTKNGKTDRKELQRRLETKDDKKGAACPGSRKIWHTPVHI